MFYDLIKIRRLSFGGGHPSKLMEFVYHSLESIYLFNYGFGAFIEDFVENPGLRPIGPLKVFNR